MNGKDIEIKIVNSEDEFKLFWEMHSEYMNRDIFPNEEIDLKMTEGERKWFSSPEYKKLRIVGRTKRLCSQPYWNFGKSICL